MTFKVKTKGQNEGEKLLKPKLRFKEFKDNWTLMSLNSLMEFKNGINATKDAYGKGIKYISVTDILNNNFITYEKIKGLVNIDNITLKNNSVTYGDVVFQRSSETIEDIGRANVYLDHNKVATFGGFVIRGKKKGDYNPLFINYLLQNSSSRKAIIVKGAGAQHYNISQEELEKIELYFPSIQEQEKIANLLSLLDKKIELQKRKVDALKIYKKGLSKKLFSFNSTYEKKLGDLCSITTGKLDANAMNKNGKYRFFTCAKEYYYINTYAFDTEALLISGNGAYVGYINYYKGKFNAYQRTYVLDKFNEDIFYIKYFLDEFLPLRIFSEKKDGNTPYIVLSTLSNMTIKFPAFNIQKIIVNILSKLDKKINLSEERLKLLSRLKNFLLQQMFI